MSSKLLLNRYFWDKLPSDYLDELRRFYKIYAEERSSLNNASVANLVSNLIDDLYFDIIDFFRVKSCQKSFHFSEEFCIKPISDKVKELAKHIPEINAAFNNEEKWLNLVIKTNVPSFVFLMIDKKLEKNIFNQKFWKSLINYFTTIKEFKILLGIYSVYCRIFPTDYFMFETYKKLAKKHGKIYVSWLKPFDFEIAREKTPKKAVPVSFLSMIKYIPSKKVRHFRETKEINGRIAFPGPIIYYIRKYANSYILEKLFQTCKYFFFRQPTPFCHRFIFSDSFKEMKFNYISIGTSSTAKIVPKKLFIQNALHVSQQSDKLALSKFLPNFYKLEIKFLRIHNQKLTKNEFKFIVKEGRIEIMELSDVFVYENDATAKNETLTNNLETEKPVPLEDIIKLCPKIKEFFSSPTAISPKTAEFLQNFDFQNDIKVFYIHHLNNFFNIDSFVKFLYVNAKTNSIKYSFSFSPSLDVQQVAAFGEELKQKIACISKFVAQLPVGNI